MYLYYILKWQYSYFFHDYEIDLQKAHILHFTRISILYFKITIFIFFHDYEIDL